MAMPLHLDGHNTGLVFNSGACGETFWIQIAVNPQDSLNHLLPRTSAFLYLAAGWIVGQHALGAHASAIVHVELPHFLLYVPSQESLDLEGPMLSLEAVLCPLPRAAVDGVAETSHQEDLRAGQYVVRLSSDPASL